MPLSVKELSQHRWKVIADCPDLNHLIGSIIFPNYVGRYPVLGKSNFEYRLCDYPSIFKYLQWWEERKSDEMPEYVKTTKGDVYKLIWQSKHTPSDVTVGCHNKEKKWFEYSHTLYELLPATKEEYEASLKIQHS